MEPTSKSFGRIQSTTSHRKSQRSCGITELARRAFIPPDNTTAQIPIKLVQVLLSSQAFFKPTLTPLEKTAHGLQASIALGQLTLLSLLFFNKNECNCVTSSFSQTCLAITYLDYLYNAILLTGWVPSELSKEPYKEEPTSPQAEEPEEGEEESNDEESANGNRLVMIL